jgi:hypothetical protein
MNKVAVVPQQQEAVAGEAKLIASREQEYAEAQDATPDRQPVDRELIRWQTRLLPFMSAFILLMAAAFFLFSGLHIYEVTKFIQAGDEQDVRAEVESEIAKQANTPLTAEDVTQHSLLLLEADVLDKRYHQAGGLLMSRIWSRQLAFVTGMVMAFVGAVFILGKLSEESSQISGGANGWKVAISSASPGIILSLFGTVVIVASLFVKATLDVSDGPVYVVPLQHGVVAAEAPGRSNTGEKIPPLDLKEIEKLGQPNQKPQQ